MKKRKNTAYAAESETAECAPIAKTGEKAKAQKIVLIVLIAAVVITALYFLPYDKILSLFRKEKPKENIYFFPPDFETNILMDPDYLEFDRYLRFTIGSETFTVTDGNYEALGKGCETIHAYIDAMVRGDCDAYNALFTESYYEENEPKSRFPMQRVHDVHAVLYLEHTYTKDELDGAYEGVIQYRYCLNYYIEENDGMVRDDMGSGVSAPIYLELLTDPSTGQTRINSISFLETR